jgi:PPOX class probable F420-dependent enzyme
VPDREAPNVPWLGLGIMERVPDQPEAIPETHRDLLESRVAIMATVGPDGRPQVSALWFLAQDGAVKISLNTSRQKTKNLMRNPKVSVVLMDHANPHRYVELRGDAEVEPDSDFKFRDLIGAKYGTDLGSRDRPGEGRVIVTIHPVRVRPWG